MPFYFVQDNDRAKDEAWSFLFLDNRREKTKQSFFFLVHDQKFQATLFFFLSPNELTGG